MEILVFTADAPTAGRAPGAPAHHPARSVLPSLELLDHNVRRATNDVQALMSVPKPDVVLVDARDDLLAARSTCRLLRAGGLTGRLIVVVDEGGLAGLSADWGIDDFVLPQINPAELAARLRLAETVSTAATSDSVRVGDLVIELTTYAAKIKGRPLDLTYKEFELLRFLAQHPGRVFTREQLLREVWGYDYFGGTRTVDVHVRRLRSKLGSEHEALIGTVRQVGYKLVTPPPHSLPADDRVSV